MRHNQKEGIRQSSQGERQRWENRGKLEGNRRHREEAADED